MLYVAIVVGAIIFMVVGSLWYSVLFGKRWRGYMGFTEESMKQMPLTPLQAMGLGFCVALINAFVLSRFIMEADPIGAAFIAAWIWIGFSVPVAANSFLWEGKPFGLFVLNAGNLLVSGVLSAAAMAFILG